MKSTKGRIKQLEARLAARIGMKEYAESCKAIEIELERLRNAKTEN